MIIAVDKAQKEGKHDLKHNQMIELGHELISLPLPVGDYILVNDAVNEVIRRRGDKLKKMDLLGVTKRSVDSKANLEEIYGNVIGKQHARFRDECILAQQNGIDFYVLIESAPEVKTLEQVKAWKNWPQLYAYCKRNHIRAGQGMMERIEDFVAHGGQKPPVDGEQLYKAMKTMAGKYGFKWAFCSPENAGKAIIYLLTKDGSVPSTKTLTKE